MLITAIEVRGQSDAGPFNGRLTLLPGLQVISARNSYGKSIVARSIAWCLGLEPLFGVPDNDPAFFPLAVRDEIDFENQRSVSVLSSECAITLTHSDARRVTIVRDIKGDPTVVRIEETAPEGGLRRSKLQARFRAMQDEHGGLQRFLFDWFGWPRAQVATFKGTIADVYLENLAPLFYIEQDEGWTDIQARQISRYAQHQIGQVAIEYLLGATDAVAARLSAQKAILRLAELREWARTTADRVNALFARHGWAVEWSGRGPVEEILSRWSSRTLRDALRQDADVDLAGQRVLLTQRAEVLRRALTSDPLDPMDVSSHASGSQAVIDLKGRRHAISDELRTVRIQHEQTDELLETIEHRIHAANDVLRLKTTGVGRFERVECPTCHRDLDPTTFALTEQSRESVAAHIEALKRDRDLMKRNVEALSARLVTLYAEGARVDADFRDAERALATITAAVGTVREQLAKAAADLTSVERQTDRLTETSNEIDELQKIIGQWAADARGVQHPVSESVGLQRRVDAFADALRLYLVALGHSAVNPANAAAIRLDEQYVVYLGTRRLQSLGSASDRSRLVAAFSLALAAVSGRVGGLHPGVVVLDEPLQQNPDDPHRHLFSEFLSKQLALHANFQTIVFTFLRPEEIKSLREQGTAVVTPEGEHLLKLNTPAEAETPEPDSPGLTNSGTKSGTTKSGTDGTSFRF